MSALKLLHSIPKAMVFLSPDFVQHPISLCKSGTPEAGSQFCKLGGSSSTTSKTSRCTEGKDGRKGIWPPIHRLFSLALLPQTTHCGEGGMLLWASRFSGQDVPSLPQRGEYSN